jgi:hypothetical protein
MGDSVSLGLGAGKQCARRAARAVVTMVVAAALASVAACGDGTPEKVNPTSPNAGMPNGLPTELPTDHPLARAVGIPKGFPIPSGAKQEVVGLGNGQALSLTGVSLDDAFTFYRKALPEAGYTIDSDNTASRQTPGIIKFTGQSVSGTVTGVKLGGQETTIVTFGKSE